MDYSGHPLAWALVVLFGGSISTAMLGILLANAYFLPGPPPRLSLGGDVVVAILGATLTGLAVPIAMFDGWSLHGLGVTVWVLAVGVTVYLAGLSVLEVRSRPDAEWVSGRPLTPDPWTRHVADDAEAESVAEPA